jgi:hypothetical protein
VLKQSLRVSSPSSGRKPTRVRKGKTYWYVKELLREWLDACATSPPALKAAKFDKDPMSHRT